MLYKYLILPLLAFSTLSYAADIKLDDRATLPVIFTHPDIKDLSDNEFFTHVKAMEYSLVTITDGSTVEWENKANFISGKVDILRSVYENETVCKAFTNVIYLRGKNFEGTGLACQVKGQWVIRKDYVGSTPIKPKS